MSFKDEALDTRNGFNALLQKLKQEILIAVYLGNDHISIPAEWDLDLTDNIQQDLSEALGEGFCVSMVGGQSYPNWGPLPDPEPYRIEVWFRSLRD